MRYCTGKDCLSGKELVPSMKRLSLDLHCTYLDGVGSCIGQRDAFMSLICTELL